jgi:prefoldin subunit 5
MRTFRSAIWGIAIANLIVMSSAYSLASTDTFTIDPTGTHSTIGWYRLVLESGDYIIWNWSSTDWLDFQLFDPDGKELMNQEQSIGTMGILPVNTTGTYSWRYSNWHTTHVYVTFFWGKIDKANVVDERLYELEWDLANLNEEYERLNQTISLMDAYLDDIESGSEIYPWLDENLTILQVEIQAIRETIEGLPTINDIERLDGNISGLDSQIDQLQKEVNKIEDENTEYRGDITILFSFLIALIAIVIMMVIRHSLGHRKQDLEKPDSGSET